MVELSVRTLLYGVGIGHLACMSELFILGISILIWYVTRTKDDPEDNNADQPDGNAL